MSGSGVTLEQAKDHLRVTHDHDLAYIQSLMDAANDHVGRYLNRPFPWKDDDGQEIEVPASVQHAVLLLVGDLYENREATTHGVRVRDNPTVMRLLDLYREGIGV